MKSQLLNLLSKNQYEQALKILPDETSDQEINVLRNLCERLLTSQNALEEIHQALSPDPSTHLTASNYDSLEQKVRRTPIRRPVIDSESAQACLEEARTAFRTGNHQMGVDLYEQLIDLSEGDQQYALLAELYDQYMTLPQGLNRYTLYVSHDFDFHLKQGDKVLDIGSGHDPFPLATHLADYSATDNAYRPE